VIQPDVAAVSAGIDDHVSRSIVRVGFHSLIATGAFQSSFVLTRVNGPNLLKLLSFACCSPISNDVPKGSVAHQDPIASTAIQSLMSIKLPCLQRIRTTRALCSQFTSGGRDSVRREWTAVGKHERLTIGTLQVPAARYFIGGSSTLRTRSRMVRSIGGWYDHGMTLVAVRFAQTLQRYVGQTIMMLRCKYSRRISVAVMTIMRIVQGHCPGRNTFGQIGGRPLTLIRKLCTNSRQALPAGSDIGCGYDDFALGLR